MPTAGSSSVAAWQRQDWGARGMSRSSMRHSRQGLLRRACVRRRSARTQRNEAAQCLAAAQDVAGAREELGLHAGVALVAVLAVHVPAAGGVLQVLAMAKQQHGNRARRASQVRSGLGACI